MASKISMKYLVSVFVISMAVLPFSMAFVPSANANSQFPKAISDLKEVIVKGLGIQAEDFRISGFDVKDMLVGHSVAYEFDVEIEKKVLPVKLLEDVNKWEDVNRWEYSDLPIFRMEDAVMSGEKNGLIEKKMEKSTVPVLAPFQLSGPMELWIQDAKDMRVSLPHDIDAGVLKKVILAEGAVVTVTGAKSVSLRQPLDLPLPLNQTQNGFAAGLLRLAEHLRRVSGVKGAPLLSLRVVGPTSLTSSPSPSSPSSSNRLKLKRLAPGLVELSSSSKNKPVEVGSSALDLPSEAPTFLTPDQFTTFWPMSSLKGSHSSLLGLEKLLSSVLGPKAHKKGSFKLLKADVSVQTYLKIGFKVDKQIREGDPVLEGLPEWRTKPEKVRMHFEALAKVEGDKVIPEKVTQFNPVNLEDTIAPNVLLGNVTLSKQPIIYQPSNPFTL